MIFRNIRWVGFLLIPFLISSCATYYQINYEFNRQFEQGNIEAAQKILNRDSKSKKRKIRFLYYANQGILASMLGNFEESNKWLEKAYLFGEDYQKNAGDIAASFLVNPNTIVYAGEDHEHLLLLYYKAINNLKLNDNESALIECRRLNNRLNELSDKYKSDNKYKRDAFIHNLLGIVYEASGDVSNAFVAYRNALNIYEEDYKNLFGLGPPDQLKKDLLRMARLNGYDSDLKFYEDKFGFDYEPSSQEDLVFFWHNGLGPVKDEWSVNFVAMDGGDGFVTFENEDLGLSFPFRVSDSNQKNELTDLRVFRIAFPKYEERDVHFQRGFLEVGNQRFDLEMAEDVNAIAFKTLEERMLKELGKGLLRAAIKKSIEMAIRGDGQGDDKESSKEEAMREGFSLLVGLINASTEKADTRNWQTIPHSIQYARIPLNVGTNEVILNTIDPQGKSHEVPFSFEVKKGGTVFHSYHSMESRQNNR